MGGVWGSSQLPAYAFRKTSWGSESGSFALSFHICSQSEGPAAEDELLISGAGLPELEVGVDSNLNFDSDSATARW